MSLPGVQTEKTMLAERDLQIRYKQQQKAMEEIRDAEEVLKHYESYKLGGDSNPELDNLLRQKRAELETKKRGLGIETRSVAAPGAGLAFDMNSKDAAAKPTREFLFAQGGAQVSAPPPSQESERDRRLRLRAEERARKQAGSATSAYGTSAPPQTQGYAPDYQQPLQAPDSRVDFRQPAIDTRPGLGDIRPQGMGAGLIQTDGRQMGDVRPLSDMRQQVMEQPRAFQQAQRPDLFDRQPGYDPLPRQYSVPESFEMPGYSTPAVSRTPKAEEAPEPSGFPFTRQEEDKKEKQRRYREELDRQQAEKRPPRPGRAPSGDVSALVDPVPSQPAPVDPVIDEKREKQRKYKEELDRMAAAKAAAQPSNDRGWQPSSESAYLPPAPYQTDRAQDDPRLKEIEKKQRYAQELREMMEEKARLKQREEDFGFQGPPQAEYRAGEGERRTGYTRQNEDQMRQRAGDDRPAYPDRPIDVQSQQSDPAAERKLQYKADLQRQMEEQKRRREEEKQRLKEQAQIEDAKYLAEYSERKPLKRVTDPNKPSSENPNAVRYDQLVGERKKQETIDPMDRPIGVAEPRARSLRAEAPALVEPQPTFPQSSAHKNLFDPAPEESKGLDLLSQYPPTKPAAYPPSTPTQSYPEPQPYRAQVPYQPRQPLAAYSGPPPASTEMIDQYYKEIQEIRQERDRAKKEMLELREMMLKEKENRLEEMIKMISAQAIGRPPVWQPGYPAGAAQPYIPQAYPQGVDSFTPPAAAQQWPSFPASTPAYAPPGPSVPSQYMAPYPPQSAENPYAQVPSLPPDQQYMSPTAQTRPDEWKPSPRFPGEPPVPADVFLKPQNQLPLDAGPGGFDYMERSMAGTSHFVDPQNMQWGTTHLLASGNKKPWGRNEMSPGEMEHSLASEVTHVPIPPLEQDPPIIEQIEEDPMEQEDEQRPSSVHTPLEPFPQVESSVTTSKPADFDLMKMSDSSRELRPRSRRELAKPQEVVIPSSLEPLQLSDSDASKGLQPRTRVKTDDVDLCNQKSGSPLHSLPEEYPPALTEPQFQPAPVEPAPRTSSASSRNRPRTLDVFKAHANTKAGGRQTPTADKPKPLKPEPRPQDAKPVDPRTTDPRSEAKPSFHRLQDVRDRKKQEKPRDGLDTLQDALEKLNQQRQGASDSVSLEGSASSQFESRFKVLALNELKGER